MKTRSLDDHQHHAFTKSGTILYQVHCQCQIGGLLNYVLLINSKLCIFEVILSTSEVLFVFRYESV